MAEDSKPFLRFPVLEDQDGAPSCSSMAQLHRMGSYSQGRSDLGLPSEGSDSSGQDNSTSPQNHRKSSRSRFLPEEDVEMKSSGSSGSGTESHSNESHGHESMGSSNGTSKDSALLESSESNKSSNSHSSSPPSSSNAFSLLSSEQDNPSTSGCSSQESAKAKTQKEVIKTLKELKLHLPAEKRHNNKSTTLNTLKYALRCVKQAEANEENYQLLMTNDSQPSGLDVSSYTIEEIDSITSEYTLKNNDIFAVAVSLVTGRIVYISDQAATILNCKRDVFNNSKFVEFLTPQDVSVFYSFTTPYRLPSWSMCTGAESSPSDCLQEKSFFCRISGGKECEGDLQYYPFRMTPYLMKVQDTVHAEDQFCCLLLAERVHSGYDAPRIPTDKRIFTTTHSPSCVFQDVDERAVPLLGYLPQDLIGTPILLHLHPSDRPIMLAIHRKILQYAGQPFDHSSVRFCARNGEYVVLDTSWSSFVNPWSHKVSFVIGRHKVRMGPVNEDVFVAPVSAVREMKTMDPDVQEITEQIHRLLLQPVHNCGSSGYGSLNNNDHLRCMTSSTESFNNGSNSKMLQERDEESSKARPRTFQEICKGIHLQKSQEQQTSKTDKKASGKSVQKSPAVVRRKDSATPLHWKKTGAEEDKASSHEELASNDQSVYSYQHISCLDSVIRYLESCNVPITMKRKCQSSSNTTSSNSDEDRQKGCNSMQGSEEIIEDIPGAGEPTENGASPCSASPSIQEQESYKRLGLTKQVLAAHTQKEEEAFLNRLRELRTLTALKADCSLYLNRQRERTRTPKDAVQATRSSKQGGPGGEPATRRGVRNKNNKSKRAKQIESSDSTVFHPKQQLRPPLLNHGLNPTSWSPSETSQTCFSMAYPAVMPGYPLQVYATPNNSQVSQAPQCPPPFHHPAHTTSMVTPFVALVLPNYMYHPIVPGPPPPQPLYSAEAGGYSTQIPLGPAVFPTQGAFTVSPSYNVQSQHNPQNTHTTHALSTSFPFPPPTENPKAAGETQSRPSTPQSGGGEGHSSPPLFESPCSSPLNLLELELCVQDSTGISAAGQGNDNTTEREKGAGGNQTKERELKQPSLSVLGPPGPLYYVDTSCVCERLSWDKVCCSLGAFSNEISSHGDGNNSDANSLSSDMFDVILHEDSCSGTGSATSGSMGSASNGCGTSASGTSNSRTSASGGSTSGISGSGTGSNTSKYFGSVDSSQNSQKVKVHLSSIGMPLKMDQSEQFNDIQKVLKEDRDKLKLLQKNQPHFTEEQKKELIEVHPWIKKGGLPGVIDIKVCSCCDGASEVHSRITAEAEDQPDMEMGDSEAVEFSCQRTDESLDTFFSCCSPAPGLSSQTQRQ